MQNLISIAPITQNPVLFSNSSEKNLISDNSMLKKIPYYPRWLFIFFFIFLLTACGKESLYQDLTERDANEILVVLFKNGVDASKTRVQQAQDVSYTIEVPQKQIHQARAILVENNLPRKKELGFSGICQEKGLIPTPEEEKCRKLLALKGEIINSLERVPGVIDADVVLNIPEISEFSTESPESKKPTASAVLRVKKEESGYEISESRMQRFIANSVENLDPRDVSVIISYVDPPQKIIAEGPMPPEAVEGDTVSNGAPLASIAGLNLSEESVKRFKIYAVVFLLVLMGISSALIINVIKLTKMRQELKVFRAQGGVPAESAPLLEEAPSPEKAQLAAPEGEKENA